MYISRYLALSPQVKSPNSTYTVPAAGVVATNGQSVLLDKSVVSGGVRLSLPFLGR